jgi:hypothetical protein
MDSLDEFSDIVNTFPRLIDTDTNFFLTHKQSAILYYFVGHGYTVSSRSRRSFRAPRDKSNPRTSAVSSRQNTSSTISRALYSVFLTNTFNRPQNPIWIEDRCTRSCEENLEKRIDAGARSILAASTQKYDDHYKDR